VAEGDVVDVEVVETLAVVDALDVLVDVKVVEDVVEVVGCAE
jgi:hypothetical protein